MGVPGNADLLLLKTAAAAGGYQVSRSLRFSSGDSAYLSKSFGSSGNRKTWTWSGWIKLSKLDNWGALFKAGSATSSPTTQLYLYSDNTLEYITYSGSTQSVLTTTQVFRDPSAWYHILLTIDTTQATANNRQRLYINGVEVTTFTNRTNHSQNYDTFVNDSTYTHEIGRTTNIGGSSAKYFDGYMADIWFLDGIAATPSDFAETDATTGQWIPKAYTGSKGTNGFHLEFADNSAATAAALGKDTANSNNWTPNNFSVTAGAGNDSLVDTPTSYGTDTGAGGEVRGNYCTLNPLDVSSLTTSDGNLRLAASAAGYVRGTMNLAGKTYWEVTITTAGLGGIIGVMQPNGAFPYTNSNGYHSGGTQYVNGSSIGSWGASWTTGDVIGIAVDADAGTITAYKNGSSQGSKSISSTSTWMPWVHSYDGTYNCNFGQRAFAYTAPSGFKALCDTNLTAPVIAKPSTVMDVKLYTGNGGSSQTVTGLGFSPDLVWFKARSSAYNNGVFDSVRGVQNRLHTNLTDAEDASPTGLTAFNSDGFTFGANNVNGANGVTYVAWAWDAGTSTVTNTQGSITSSVRANASAGFSIVTYTGAASGTVGHGLGVAPHLIIAKSRTVVKSWVVYHKDLGINQYLLLNSTNAAGSATGVWGSSAPTSTVFGLETSSGGGNNDGNLVAYCFAPVAGYSSFGSFSGGSNPNFVHLGFRPRFVMIKRTDTTNYWIIQDAARNTYNQVDLKLAANASVAENDLSTLGDTTQNQLDFVSNGFVCRSTNAGTNASGGTYIYCAWAESPFQYARAR